jgi:hypothetical protein
VPLALAPGVLLGGRAGGAARALAPWAALPALLLAHRPPMPASRRCIRGCCWGRGWGWTTGQVFLLFTALLWTVAGVYARAYLRATRRGRASSSGC